MSVNMAKIQELENRIPKGETRTRFAPSPTGYMHVGNLRTALYAYLIAKNQGGKFLLRIEDTDQGRLVEDAAEVIYKTLRQCRLFHDEGPDLGGPVGPYIQTDRREIYELYASLLLEKGGAYRCFCGKEDAEPAGSAVPGHKYDGRCSRLTEAEIQEKLGAGVPFVIRQKIPGEGETTFHDEVFGDITVPNETLDDNVLIKSDGLPTYNFANVVDDHLMGITHVVRGSEYLSSSPKYNLLYESFGWEIPKYIHCPPVMRDAQNKMSKRKGDPSYEDLLAEGYLTEAVLNYVALLGWSPGGEREIYTLDELTEVFHISGISKSPAIFDKEKLTYFNSTYIRAMAPDAFARVAEPYIRSVVKNEAVSALSIAELLQPRCEKLTDIAGKIGFFETLPDYETDLFVNAKSKSSEAVALELLPKVKASLEALGDWTHESIQEALNRLSEETGLKKATLMWPLRIALSGQTVTPGGAVEICQILGREACFARIHLALTKLSDKTA